MSTLYFLSTLPSLWYFWDIVDFLGLNCLWENVTSGHISLSDRKTVNAPKVIETSFQLSFYAYLYDVCMRRESSGRYENLHMKQSPSPPHPPHIALKPELILLTWCLASDVGHGIKILYKNTYMGHDTRNGINEVRPPGTVLCKAVWSEHTG